MEGREAEKRKTETINTAKGGNGQKKEQCNGQSKCGHSTFPGSIKIELLFIFFFFCRPQFPTFLLQTLTSSPTFPFSHRAACRLIFSPWVSFTHFFLLPPRTPSAGPPNSFYMYATLHFRLGQRTESAGFSRGRDNNPCPAVICLFRDRLDDAPERGAPRAAHIPQLGTRLHYDDKDRRPMASLESK